MGAIDNDDKTWHFDAAGLFANGQGVDAANWPVLVIGCGPLALELGSSAATVDEVLAAARRINEAIWMFSQAVKTRSLLHSDR